MSPDRSYFSSKLLTYSMLAALLITSICQIYSFLKFKSNYQLKSENIARAGNRLSIRFKAANESFVRYANDYTHLNRLITVKDSKVLSEAFNAFNQWGDVHLQLADERANLEHQLYANRQNALSLKKNFDQRFGTLKILVLTHILLGLVFFVFGYVIDLWVKDHAERLQIHTTCQ